MGTNPQIPLGTLNRLLTQVTWNSFPSLNVTPSYLGRESVHLARDGEAVVYIPTLTGAVTSPEPYLMITMTMHLLKTQGLAGQYEAQMVSSACSVMARCIATLQCCRHSRLPIAQSKAFANWISVVPMLAMS